LEPSAVVVVVVVDGEQLIHLVDVGVVRGDPRVPFGTRHRGHVDCSEIEMLVMILPTYSTYYLPLAIDRQTIPTATSCIDEQNHNDKDS
jgi:hypothetical protein